jgi:hypothetical protein
MSAGRFITAAATALLLILGGGWVGQLHASQKGTLPAIVGDLNDAQLIEVRDQNGQVLLHGTLKTSKDTPKETEREATLESPSGQKAEGEFETEIERKKGVTALEEVELSVKHLPAMTQCELFIDGRHVTSLTTSQSGKAKLKLQRKSPAGK